jgi:MobA/MobL family
VHSLVGGCLGLSTVSIVTPPDAVRAGGFDGGVLQDLRFDWGEVPYTSEAVIVSNHINQKVLQRSRGGSALQRLAYQSCTYYNNGRTHADYSRFAEDHQGGVILLPYGAREEFADECNFVMAVAFRETRVDAQEGRAVDFALPRELPEKLLLPVAAFVMAAFVRQGMAVRIDIECPQASDNGRNPHAHGYVAMRVLEPDGFGLKEPEWNRQFRRDSGRYFRAVIAARVTLACALVGVAAHMDPRRNEERGLPKPERRYPAPLWRMYDRLSYVAPIENLKAERKRKKEKLRTLSAPQVNTSGTVVVSNAVSNRDPMSEGERNQRMNFLVPFVQDLGVETRGSSAGILLATSGGSVLFDGEALTVEGTAGHAQAQLIIKLAGILDWPAMVVEGDSRSTDEIILAGIPVGLTATNTCASAGAIRLITKKYPNLLADVIRPFDPCSIVDGALKHAAATFKMVELTRVEYELPGTEHPTAEEEERRKSADLLIQNWMALQNERVQSNSSRGVGGPGALADSPEGKPP